MAQDFKSLKDDIDYFVGTKLDAFIEEARVELIKEAEDFDSCNRRTSKRVGRVSFRIRYIYRKLSNILHFQPECRGAARSKIYTRNTLFILTIFQGQRGYQCSHRRGHQYQCK